MIKINLFTAFMLFALVVSGREISVTEKQVIVIPAAASATEKFAASELSHYVKMMSGKELKIVSSDAGFKTFTFYIGKTTADIFDKKVAGSGLDSFVLVPDDNSLIIVGGSDRGTLYGVYEFLEQQGFRWFFPGKLGEVVPERKTLIIPDRKQRHVPSFIQREVQLGVVKGMKAAEIVDWAVKNRTSRIFGLRNGLIQKRHPEVSRDIWTKRGGEMQWQWICHNFKWMINERHWKKHPDYFPLYKGKRVNIGSHGGGVPCLTNPGVIKTCADFAMQWFKDHPQGSVVPMWPGDGLVKWCECTECKKLGGKNFMPGKAGSMSKRLVSFVNKVAEIVGKKYPDRYLLLPAYASYKMFSPGTKLRKNVLVQYCFHGCYAHAPDGCKVNRKPLAQMKQWASVAPNRIGLWDYFLLGDHHSATDKPISGMLPVTYRASTTLKNLKQLKFSHYFTQASPKYWQANMLPWYATMRLAWNADLNIDALIDDFCTRLYGNQSGKALAAYYKLINRKVQRGSWHPTIYADVAEPSPVIFDKALMAAAEKYLVLAENAAKTPMYRKRVAIVRKTFEAVKSGVKTRSLTGLDPKAPWTLKRGKTQWVLNSEGKVIPETKFKSLEIYAKDTNSYTRQFQKLLFRARKRAEKIVFLENKRITVGVIPGIGGRIVELSDRANGENYIFTGTPELKVKSIAAGYIDYGGYEEYIGKGFAGPGWEVPYKYTIKDRDKYREIAMKAVFPGLELKRRVIVPKGDTPEMIVVSTLTNTSGEKVKLSLRSHPQFTLGAGCGEQQVLIKRKDGTFRLNGMMDNMEFLREQPQGFWAIINPQTKRALVNRFDAGNARCYLLKMSDKHFNLELFGKQQTLAPGKSLVLRQTFRIASGVDEIKKLNPALNDVDVLLKPLKKLSVAPVGGTGVFTAGKIGQAVRADAKNPLMYAETCLKANGGTLEFWYKPEVGPAGKVNKMIFCSGTNSPNWFFATLGNGTIYWLFKNGRAPYRAPGECYATLRTKVADWKNNQWRHLAFVWADLGPGKSMMQIYLDGKLTADNYRATIADSFKGKAPFRLGYLRGNTRPGLIDELRVSNRPHSPAEIKKSYESGVGAQKLTPQNDTLLLLHFDGNPDGVATTDSAANAAEIKNAAKPCIK
jgi:Domain of unknown function (DUF4838)/Concanavalin A-like lectin/glucanases superfamily/Glycosyl hydrolase family 67 N-terminus